MLSNASPSRTAKLGVVVPLANEAATVDDLFKRILQQLTPDDSIFCVLDHVSVDETRQLVETAARDDARVKLVWAPENRSVVDAYFRGYREALEAGCDWVLEMDGGMSHRPEEIPRFVQAMEDGADFAAGSRFIPGGSHIGAVPRKIISKGGTLLTNLLLGTRMRDMTSGFECFSNRAMEYVVARGVRSRQHFFQTEIRYMLHEWRWVEVPITYEYPSASIGKSSMQEALRNLWWLYRQRKGDRNGRPAATVRGRHYYNSRSNA